MNNNDNIFFKGSKLNPRIKSWDVDALTGAAEAIPADYAPSARDAARELIDRANARNNLLSFARYMVPSYKLCYAHKVMSDALMTVLRGNCRRLIITLPPRIGKSTLVSNLLPCFAFAHYPDIEFAQCGYSLDISLYHSEKAKEFFSSQKYNILFPHMDLRGTAYKKRRKWKSREWHTDYGGKYYAVGVGGGFVGRGANIIVVDDPIKNFEEANSARIRDKIITWFKSTTRTRLTPNPYIEPALIVTMARWHKDDLVGYLLEGMAQEDGEQWTVVNIPAILPDGTSCCEELYSVAKLAEYRRDLGERLWSALYMQEPLSAFGNLFARQWFTIVGASPATGAAKKVRYWDCAATAPSGTSDPDYTVGVLMSSEGGRYYIEDVVRLRDKPLQVERAMQQTAALDGVGVRIVVEREGGASGKAFLDRIRREVLQGYTVQEDRAQLSKALRAEPLASAAEAGNVHVVRGAWNSAFLDELQAFPDGKHDDQVDAASGAFAALTDNVSREVHQTIYHEQYRRF